MLADASVAEQWQGADADEYDLACSAQGWAATVKKNRHQRRAAWSESEPEGRWRAYSYEELVARDKCSLDIFWLKDESLSASESLPAPEVIARDIVEDLRAALEQFESVALELGPLEQ